MLCSWETRAADDVNELCADCFELENSLGEIDVAQHPTTRDSNCYACRKKDTKFCFRCEKWMCTACRALVLDTFCCIDCCFSAIREATGLGSLQENSAH
jgi:hypothetical protein